MEPRRYPPPRSGSWRAVGIWVTGLLASAIIGYAMGAYFQRPDGPSGGALWGMLAALGIFTCARLWLAGKPKS